MRVSASRGGQIQFEFHSVLDLLNVFGRGMRRRYRFRGLAVESKLVPLYGELAVI